MMQIHFTETRSDWPKYLTIKKKLPTSIIFLCSPYFKMENFFTNWIFFNKHAQCGHTLDRSMVAQSLRDLSD